MKYTGNSSLPDLSDEEFQAERATARPYTACILKAGPKIEMPGPDIVGGITKIIWQHSKRNVALHMAGLPPVVCPAASPSRAVSGQRPDPWSRAPSSTGLGGILLAAWHCAA